MRMPGRRGATGIVPIDQTARALSDCSEAIELDPKMSYAYRVRALVQLSARNPQAALPDANRALELTPNSPSALNVRCHTYVALQKYTQARNDCNAALAIDPSSDIAYFYRGEAELNLAEWDGAIADLEKSRQLNSEETNADYWLALAFMGKGSYAEALASIDLTSSRPRTTVAAI